MLYIEATVYSVGHTVDGAALHLVARNRTSLSSGQMRRIIDTVANTATAQGASAPRRLSPSARMACATPMMVSLFRDDSPHGIRPATVAVVQRLMGHADICTPERYLRHVEETALAFLAPIIEG